MTTLREKMRLALEAVSEDAGDLEVAETMRKVLEENKPAELDVSVSIKVCQPRAEVEAMAEWLTSNRRMYLRKLVDAIGLDNEIAVTGIWVDKKPLPLDHLHRPEAK